MGFGLPDPLGLFGGGDKPQMTPQMAHDLIKSGKLNKDRQPGVYAMVERLASQYKAPPEAPEAPDIAAAIDAQITATESRDAKLRRRGRAAGLLTGSSGAGLPNSASKTLLGE